MLSVQLVFVCLADFVCVDMRTVDVCLRLSVWDSFAVHVKQYAWQLSYTLLYQPCTNWVRSSSSLVFYKAFVSVWTTYISSSMASMIFTYDSLSTKSWIFFVYTFMHSNNLLFHGHWFHRAIPSVLVVYLRVYSDSSVLSQGASVFSQARPRTLTLARLVYFAVKRVV